ncbi:antiviral reverse transcriptase Drt4 [Kerstersia gyiorum]|uniref:antiviral reverse transcriptase Drt4 n=1 Tax=Kerstersia gyiorum TaxID=206506 RepID=UPI00209CDD61|nr:antiviral reverse transcriptase Drt4 [Kerstersia gyiorum]MCP1636962.1 hypothetical protein [Kerstersia gyiorum]MCP1670439.1 hypothetical protein [Kerstersia gyiorum]MCP1708347.1 hypothetical protein [Kerstersia gyiorum]
MLDKRTILEGLTRWNYFPNQKKYIGEISPIFNTRTFTPEVSAIIAGEKKRLGGYDSVDYRATRHSNVPRVLSLIHPAPYSRLVEVLVGNFDEWAWISTNPSSSIYPEPHDDGRIVVMNYDDQDTRVMRQNEKDFSSKFRVHADISHCFGSVYTHAIEWAAKGLDQSKADRAKREGGPKHWSSNLDYAQALCKRCETQGIAIGPATSNIIVEIILGEIDKTLRGHGYQHVRYIDDYSCSCKSYDDAEKFILLLDGELRKYRLSLNLHKTKITALPEPISDDWVADLILRFPNKMPNQEKAPLVSRSDVLSFLDHAIRLNKITPDGSVLKFALSMLAGRSVDYANKLIFEYCFNLAWHYPIVLPYLDKFAQERDALSSDYFFEKVNLIICEHAFHARSDAMSWGLYFLLKYNGNVTKSAADAILKSEDCMALLLLSQFPEFKGVVIGFVKENLVECDSYRKDRNWVLLYELFFQGEIENPYDDNVFIVLRDHGVRFLCDDTYKTKAENYCGFFSVAHQAFGLEVPEFNEYIRG